MKIPVQMHHKPSLWDLNHISQNQIKSIVVRSLAFVPSRFAWKCGCVFIYYSLCLANFDSNIHPFIFTAPVERINCKQTYRSS